MMCTIQDIFIAKFNSSGVGVWATYYGDDQSEWARDIVTDQNDNIYVVGLKSSNTLLHTLTGAYNATNGSGLILEFNNSGVPIWGYWLKFSRGRG